MRFPIVLGLSALFAAACGSNDPGTPNGPCGDNHACPADYTCDLKTNICVKNGGGNPDGGGTIDGPRPDGSTSADAGNRPDGGGAPDAGGGGAPDGGGTTNLVTTIDPQFEIAGPINDTTPTFDLSATIAGATFECKIDGGDFVSCASPFTTDVLSEGSHTLTVRATAGTLHELNPPHVDFTIDLTAPVVSIDSPAEGATIGANSTLIYSANELLKEFDCSFDDGATFSPCGAGLMGNTLITLGDGEHTAIVKGTDLAGNPSQPVTRHFTIDSAALTVNVLPRTTQCANESIAFTASKQTNVTFSCSLDGTVTDPCTSPFVLPGNITSGMHTFIVTATDELQRIGVGMLSFNVDIRPIQVGIDGIFPPADAFNRFDPRGEVAFSVTGGSVDTATAECAIDGNNPEPCTVSPDGQGTFDYENLKDDVDHSFTVVVTNACGSMASDTLSFEVDSTPPAPCLVDAFTANGGDHLQVDGGGCLPFAETGATGSITFNAEAGTYVCQVDTAVCDVPGKIPGVAPLPIGQAFTCKPGVPIQFSDLSDCGENGKTFTLTVSGTDVHGNSSRVMLPWTVDSTPPVLEFGEAVSTDNGGNFTVTVTSNEALALSGPNVPTCSIDFADFSTCTEVPTSDTQITIFANQLPAGLNTLAVNATDHWANTRVAEGPDVQTQILYTPNAGRLLVIGHDYELEDDSLNTTKILTAALGDVPWKKNGLDAFDRSVHVVMFNPNARTDNEAQHIDAILKGVGATVTSFDDPNDLPQNLIGNDILLIPDQNDNQAILDVSGVFGDTEGGVGSVIQTFLNDGGTVIVLDGWENDTTTPSDTFLAVSAFINIDDVEDFFDGSTIPYFAGLNDTLTVPRDLADLFIGTSYDEVNSTVAFFVDDSEQPRTDYGFSQRSCGTANNLSVGPRGIAVGGCTLATVVEKIFPVYVVSAPESGPNNSLTGGPGDPITIAVDPDTTAVGRLDCALLCIGQLCPCPGDGVRQCTCESAGATDVNGNPRFPLVTSDYFMEVYVVDTHGRPGRSIDLLLNDTLPIDISDTNGTATGATVVHHICWAADSHTVKPIYSMSFNGIGQDVEDPPDAHCPAGTDQSFTTTACGDIVVSVTDSANDNFGSTSISISDACDSPIQ